MRLRLSPSIPLAVLLAESSASAFNSPWGISTVHRRSPAVPTTLRREFPASCSRSRLVSHRLASSTEPAAEKSSSDDKTDAFKADILSRFSASECDDVNTPPSLASLISSIRELKSGSDIRGQFVDHPRVGSIVNVSHAIRSRPHGSPAALTPLAAYFLGHSFANMVKVRTGRNSPVICVGRDPRVHGVTLADAFSRGAESVEGTSVVYTGLATTPSMFEFCRADKCDGAVMVSASHLPEDRNGLKFFTKNGGFTGSDVDHLIEGAVAHSRHWYGIGVLPPSSGTGAVDCSEHVDFMPHYGWTLKEAIVNEVCSGVPECDLSEIPLPLAGLRIVLNAGNGAGYFFNDILKDLGADVSSSVYLTPDGTFPAGVPNPERESMIEETKRICEECDADIGVMLDTDADRAGFVLPRTVGPHSSSDYEPLNRNRLIALLSVIFSSSSPGCTIVTDSVTSEGLAHFLEDKLGLHHVRYLKGYANVIGKARELTESGRANAEMAIETSGHCAMRENGYLDDGTYTAVKVIGLLARVARSRDEKGEGMGKGDNKEDAPHMSLLDLISELDEMGEVSELRMDVLDGTLDTMRSIFDRMAEKIEAACANHENPVPGWRLDEENLEGVRVRTGGGGFFMLRKSLHDPVVSLQVEATGKDDARDRVIFPLLDMFEEDDEIDDAMDFRALQSYSKDE